MKEVTENLNRRAKGRKKQKTFAQSKKIRLGEKFLSLEVIREVGEKNRELALWLLTHSCRTAA